MIKGSTHQENKKILSACSPNNGLKIHEEKLEELKREIDKFILFSTILTTVKLNDWYIIVYSFNFFIFQDIFLIKSWWDTNLAGCLGIG